MATLLAFHAHPDDEALLTGGTLARAAAEGHRVVIVTGTDGLMDARPADGSEPPRLRELRAGGEALGAARVETLGYADSGHGPLLYADPPDRARFVRADLEEAAERLAAILREESADVLLSYDPSGGYGHRDHIRVHEVGARAAELAGTPRVLEATLPREAVVRLVRLVHLLRIPFPYDADALPTAYSPRAAITHAIDVRPYARAKQRAIAAHHSALTGTGRLAAAMRLGVRLPPWVFGLLLGREWYVERRRTAAGATPMPPR
ncbi:PIG-L family deacetylase [Streptomyces armeniacus]|uniref:PIG-L family deacetylase n=1 Tax=Streptomyces armeniacus TaxID=83291 RepID=A0A345XRC1_9ACTN|nr:PIG-L family deacetylase [Streptomyces armeniacus]AXK34187.1 PIG-L family deacetylase [Streptomyces armeniacus]